VTTPTDDPEALLDGVVRVLARTCRALGEAGEPQSAARLAASAWTLLRHDHPVQAERLNGAMHHLARLEASLEPTTRPKGHHHDRS